MGNAEDRRGCANPDCERADRGERESRRSQQGPHRVTGVAAECVEPGKSPLVAHAFAGAIEATEITARRAARVVQRQAVPLVLGSQVVEMRLNFVVELLVHAPADEQRAGSGQQHTPCGHDGSSSSRLTTATVRSHSSVSAASCLLPARVMA